MILEDAEGCILSEFGFYSELLLLSVWLVSLRPAMIRPSLCSLPAVVRTQEGANKGNLRAVLSFERLHFNDQISCQYSEQGPDVNQDSCGAPRNVGPSVRLDIYSEI